MGYSYYHDNDITTLQYAFDALQNRSDKWLLNLKINNCQVVSFGRSVDKSCNNYTIRDCNNRTIPLQGGIQYSMLMYVLMKSYLLNNIFMLKLDSMR